MELTPKQEKECQQFERDIAALGNRIDVTMREYTSVVRLRNQQYAVHMEEARHNIKSSLSVMLNALSMMKVRIRTNSAATTEEAVNNG